MFILLPWLGLLSCFSWPLEMILGVRLYREESPSTASVCPLGLSFDCLVAGTMTHHPLAQSGIPHREHHRGHCIEHDLCLCRAQELE